MSFVKEKNLENEMLLYKFYDEFLFNKIEDYMNYYRDDFYEFEDFNVEDEYYFDRCYYEFMFIVMNDLYDTLRLGGDYMLRVNLLAFGDIIAQNAEYFAQLLADDKKYHYIDEYMHRVYESIYAQLCHLSKDIEKYINK